MGILEVLTIIFVVLKLVGVITWSWWLVFLPLIIAATIYVIIFAIQLIVAIKAKREFDKMYSNLFK